VIARLWDLATSKEVMQFVHPPGAWISRVSISPDNTRLLTASLSIACLWDMKTGKQIQQIPSYNAILSPDGQMIFALDPELGGTYTLWDSETGTKKLATFVSKDTRIDSPVFSPNSALVLTRDHDATLQTWNVRTGYMQSFKGNEDVVSDIGFTPEGKMVFSIALDQIIRFWHVNTGQEVKKFTLKMPRRPLSARLLINGDGKRLYVVCYDGYFFRCALLDADTGAIIMEWLNRDRDDFVGFSPDGSRFLMTQSWIDLKNGRPATWYDSKTGKAIQ
jgi:WD40 repeat protein